MTVWLGQSMLWLLVALGAMTALWATFRLVHSQHRSSHYERVERDARYLSGLLRLMFVGLSLLMALLIWAFLSDDFRLAYVARHSALTLPFYYKIAAVWGGHEGSLLLWVWLLSAWIGVTTFHASLPGMLHFRLLTIQAWLLFAFVLFLAATSTPFTAAETVLPDGLGLNPLLQDWALALHPPMLYMGYVGVVPAFALVMAMLWHRDETGTNLRWSQPYLQVAWVFLTLGIALGSFWAYYELGWGGWWFWDPVENASLLPWLVLTAALHTTPIASRQPRMLGFAMFLVIVVFVLTLLGAFLVRSGILSSVHAFAVDPTRGRMLLLFTLWVAALAFLMLGLRRSRAQSGIGIAFLSRETLVFFASLLFLVMMLTVLLGTLYPIVIRSMGISDLSVGAPYFNQVMAPLTWGLVALMGLTSVLSWQNTQPRRLLRRLTWQVSGALIGGILFWWALPVHSPDTLAVSLMASWLVASVVVWGLRYRAATASRSLSDRPKTLSGYPIGAWVAHAGFVLLLLGMVLSTVMEQALEIRLQPGESMTIHDQTLLFEKITEQPGANYLTQQAHFRLNPGEPGARRLRPEKRTYIGQKMPVAEVAIHSTLARDLYIAMGEKQGKQAWSFRIQYTPWIRALWTGVLLMALGGAIAWGQRHWRKAQAGRELG
ncbi:heme lyase CcmF/NrfE family subunit [Hydrogenovibrio halophilus]|uniref:heme lyase CcmF/NrfE family subunit n=1 Tax=Hydrogenovibrio halophilus TaxID=373391 RepID=UPI0003719458|nr:heme lyase CcmF/NrfE family subunit [Hydrogenovibrio halophilus]